MYEYELKIFYANMFFPDEQIIPIVTYIFDNDEIEGLCSPDMYHRIEDILRPIDFSIKKDDDE